MSTHTGTITPVTITLSALAGQVFAQVTDEAGTLVASLATADNAGMIRRMDRQLRERGIVREAYATEAGDMIAAGWVLS